MLETRRKETGTSKSSQSSGTVTREREKNSQ